MKTNRFGVIRHLGYCLAVLVMLVGLVALTGCGGNDKSSTPDTDDSGNEPNSLVGRWSRTDGGGAITFTENRYTAYNSVTGCTNYADYTLSGDTLYATITSTAGPLHCSNTETNSAVGYAVSGATLTFYYPSGQSYTCIKQDEDDSDSDGPPPDTTPVGDLNADYTNNIGMTFNFIPAGAFTMGSPPRELGRRPNETRHPVTLTKAFYMQTTEVTQGQWKAVMGNNPSYFNMCGDNCPVETVSWQDVQDFIAALNSMGEGTYRLPTEAEWEYASRAGSPVAFANGDITATECNLDPNLDAMGWYCYNSDHQSHPVAYKQANSWGLYDMHGNVWEWCSDWFSPNLGNRAVTDPVGPETGTGRVLRGGSWRHYTQGCRSANRVGENPDEPAPPDNRLGLRGFRLVMELYTNSLGMSFFLIPAGTFTMGSPPDELDRYPNETQHPVTLTKAFFMQTTEVTQGQWKAVMGNNPSYFSVCGDDCPVETVSWEAVQEFIAALNSMGEGTYRLPTEAEWEYASRAGSTVAFANGDITATECNFDPNLDVMGWYCYNSDHRSHPVAQKESNSWRLYDMHGNVWEWCSDWFSPNLGNRAVTDPVGPETGTGRVLRGGSWSHDTRVCRSAHRVGDNPDERITPDYRLGVRGLRLVRGIR